MPQLVIDGRRIEVPANTNLIEAARLAGIDIPYFCYHPYLTVVGQCRICLVEIEGQPRLAIACATPAAEGMIVRSETSPRVKEAREAVMEFLLANHPLDCPVCDQAGECLLQDHSMAEQGNRFATHMVETRRTFPGFERRLIGPHVVQNQNRCIHCSRCIRVTREISETSALTYKSRGNSTYIDTFDGGPFDDPFSACAADVCPVGALTIREFRFRKRAWKLRSTPSVCPGCSIGCNIWIDHDERLVYRFTPRENPDVNATWLCDYGRFLADSLNEEPATAVRHRVSGESLAVSRKEALLAIGQELRTARTLHIVASANLSTEELFLARELFAGELKGELVVPVDPGQPKRMKNGRGEWLNASDAHPNSSGARLLGLTIVDGERLRGFLGEAADLTVLLDPTAHPFLATDEALRSLRPRPTLVIGRGSHALADQATWLVPGATQACNEGTFVSSLGALQRFSAAFAPSGEERPLWRILTWLAAALGASQLALSQPAEVFSLMASREKAFFGASWGSPETAGIEPPGEHQHVG